MGWWGTPSKHGVQAVESNSCEELSVSMESRWCWVYGMTCLWVFFCKVFPSMRSDILFLFSWKMLWVGWEIARAFCFLKTSQLCTKESSLLHASFCCTLCPTVTFIISLWQVSNERVCLVPCHPWTFSGQSLGWQGPGDSAMGFPCILVFLEVDVLCGMLHAKYKWSVGLSGWPLWNS